MNKKQTSANEKTTSLAR